VSNSIKVVSPSQLSPVYSGFGIEFSPPGTTNSAVHPILHETGYLPNNAKWNFPSVLSPFWRVYYNLDGGHRIFIDDEAHELIPGRLCIIPDQVFIHCEGEHPVRHFWMAFSLPGRRIDLEHPLPIALAPSTEESGLVAGISALIEGAANHPQVNAVYHQSMALLHLLFARLDLNWKPPLPDNLTRLLDFIDHHAHEGLPNQILARKAGMSIATLCRVFQSYLQTTPANYVNQVRITKAVHLLEQTNTGIDTIADQLGFPNRAYFSRVFKQVTTLAPGEYRKRRTIHRATTRATKRGTQAGAMQP
jgi:AraC-like DNA-binding protein